MQESSFPAGASDSATPPSSTGQPTRPPSRRTEWLLVLVAVGAAAVAFNFRGRYGKGTMLDVPITLVTSDREDLGCSFRETFGRYRCENKSNGEKWPNPPAPSERLAPYYSEDRRLFLIPGLFEQPALAERYRRDDPTGRPRDALRRFSVRCKLRLLLKTEGFEVRWLHDDAWHSSSPAWVAEASQCTVQDK
jgi:hypothetical protein